MAKKKKSSDAPSGLMAVITRPWFVLSIMIVCFGILTPKIFLPLFRQLFGLSKPTPTRPNPEDFGPPDRSRYRPASPPPQASVDADSLRSAPHHSFAGPRPTHGGYGHQPGGGSGGGKSSFLSFLLPIYAVGIGVYMVYTLFKVFNKDDKKDGDDENSGDEDDFLRARTVRFKENDFITSNLNWDAVNGEFKMKRGDSHFAQSQESEDELDDYASYRNLDPDYVSYLKELRRAKRASAGARPAATPTSTKPTHPMPSVPHSHQKPSHPVINEEKEEEENTANVEIPLTPNIGLTSITNTNVLVNDTLERMKFSLNKINTQLAEKKAGASFEGDELEELHLQLSQTELQMAKILKIVNTASDSFNHHYAAPGSTTPVVTQPLYEEDDDEDDYSDEEQLQRHMNNGDYDDEDDRRAESYLEEMTMNSAGCPSSSSDESSSSSSSRMSSEAFNSRSSSEGGNNNNNKNNNNNNKTASVRRAELNENRFETTRTTPANPATSGKMLTEEGLRKRRLKKKNNRKRAKINKKNKSATSNNKKEE